MLFKALFNFSGRAEGLHAVSVTVYDSKASIPDPELREVFAVSSFVSN
jgi:hypothetical protein